MLLRKVKIYAMLVFVLFWRNFLMKSRSAKLWLALVIIEVLLLIFSLQLPYSVINGREWYSTWIAEARGAFLVFMPVTTLVVFVNKYKKGSAVQSIIREKCPEQLLADFDSLSIFYFFGISPLEARKAVNDVNILNEQGSDCNVFEVMNSPIKYILKG
jgi:hypothetical protein